MKHTKTTRRITGVAFFMGSSALAIAQARSNETIQLDTLTKVIGIALTLGGFFMGFMQMKMANKIAEVEAKFKDAIGGMRHEFTSIIHNENEKQNDKLRLGLKELEAKIVTRHDLNNFETIMKLRHDSITDQLSKAAWIYKKDNEK